MRNIISFLCLCLCLSFLIIGCDKIEPPYKEEDTGNNNGDSIKRKILLEDYTGHTCGNCPRAAETAEQLKQLYGDQLITIGVHVGWFAEPCPPHPLPGGAPSGSFSTDFRTAVGDDYNAQFSNDAAGLPNGMVNRKPISGSSIITYSNWGTVITDIINAAPEANIIITNNYNETSRELNTSIETEFLSSLNGSYKLVVLLTEDSLLDWQEDYEALPTHIENYVHRHVLRDAINSSWGDTLASGTINNGSSFIKDYSYTLNSGFNDSKCSVVAFIYDTATLEILQAEEKEVK